MIETSVGAWRKSFFAGLAVVLPAVVSLAIVVFLFDSLTNFTDKVLFFLPRSMTHQSGLSGPGTGQIHWYWKLLAMLVVVQFITMIGRFARHYIGRKLIEGAEQLVLRVPLVNKIYGAVKQVNQAFSSENKTAFKQVVLVEFPRKGMYSVGFVTGEQHHEVQYKTRENVVSIFIPTTPNPTTGFLILVSEQELIRLEMPVADGIKFIISLGAVSPDYRVNLPQGTSPAVGDGGDRATTASTETHPVIASSP